MPYAIQTSTLCDYTIKNLKYSSSADINVSFMYYNELEIDVLRQSSQRTGLLCRKMRFEFRNILEQTNNSFFIASKNSTNHKINKNAK